MRQFMLACALIIALPAVACANFDALLTAARTKDLEAVRLLLEQGADPNPPYESYDGYTPLMFSAGNGDPEMTELLLDAGAQTERRDHNGERALEWATRAYYLHGFADVPGCIRLLLDAGSPAHSDDDRLGISPLMHASEYGGEPEIMRMLLDAGAGPNRVSGLGDTALHRAAWKDGEAVGMLLAAGAEPNLTEDTLGRTPLHVAAAGSATVNARLLLDAGAQTEPRYHGGRTALFIAASNGAAGVVTALLDAGANVDAADDGGLTPILAAISGDTAATPQRRAATVRSLAELTADLDRGFAAAIAGGFDEAARLLLTRGASVDGADANGLSALAAAAARSEPAWLERLIAGGADLTRHGGQALGAAAGEGFNDRLKWLFDLGVAVDARDPYGATALMRAAAGGRVGTVEMLLERGADRNAADRAGRGTADYMAGARAPYDAAIAHAEGSRAMIDVTAERSALADLEEAHRQISDMLGI